MRRLKPHSANNAELDDGRTPIKDDTYDIGRDSYRKDRNLDSNPEIEKTCRRELNLSASARFTVSDFVVKDHGCVRITTSGERKPIGVPRQLCGKDACPRRVQ